MATSLASTLMLALLALLSQTMLADDQLVIELNRVDQSCLDILRNTTHEVSRCDFYKCFEQRFPCGAKSYIMRMAHKYCIKYHPFLDEMTQSGVDLVNHMTECMPKGFQTIYTKRRAIRCRSMRKDGFVILEKCYMEKIELFCQATKENSIFKKSMDVMDFLNGDALPMLKRISEKCGEKGDIFSLALNYGR